MSISGNVIYAKTLLLSKYHRNFITQNGVDYTVKRFPIVSGRKILPPDEIQNYIYDNIVSENPFMVARFGSIELFTTGKFNLNIKYRRKQSVDILCNNAGFFPRSEKEALIFSKLMIDSMKCCDVLGTWYLPFEDYYLKTTIPQSTVVTEARYLEPWYSDNPWTRALEGKKVLVIHPFTETIASQYKNRSLLFSNHMYLPDFELKTMKAVQTIAGTKDSRFDTWFDALDYMTEEALKIDFDIAIIGCGAYGFPLAAKLKNAGKQAIHMGGVTQAMFGIKGKRWEEDKNPIVRDLYNDYWVRPMTNEVPKEKDKVEGGCYW